MQDDSISLNRYISKTGLCSRREADRWIEEGRITINGEPAIKGNRVFPNDVVTVDGKKLKKEKAPLYLMFNKPPGITCTTDTSDRSNIIDFINHKERIFPIGRLDKSSTGLILLTNDGKIVNEILRKENRHEKEYVVTVNKNINTTFLKRMSQPIPMLGTKTMPCKIVQLKAKTFKITLTQGLNRQIRRMCEFCGYKVVTLKRIRIIDITLDGLKEGAWRYLNQEELSTLRNKLHHKKK